MVRRGRIGKLEYTTHLSPSVIRYTQDSIKSEFLNGQHLTELLNDILYNGKSPEDIEIICVVWYNDNYYAISGNRRLFLYKLLQCRCLLSTIPVEVVTVSDEVFCQYYTTGNDGQSVRVRGGAQREQEIHHFLRQFMAERRKARKKQAKQAKQTATRSVQNTNQPGNPAAISTTLQQPRLDAVEVGIPRQTRFQNPADQNTNHLGNSAVISGRIIHNISQQGIPRQTRFQNPIVAVQQPGISNNQYGFSDIDIDRRISPSTHPEPWRDQQEQDYELDDNTQHCCLLACILRIRDALFRRGSMNQPLTA